jgi:hypothetical protein
VVGFGEILVELDRAVQCVVRLLEAMGLEADPSLQHVVRRLVGEAGERLLDLPVCLLELAGLEGLAGLVVVDLRREGADSLVRLLARLEAGLRGAVAATEECERADGGGEDDDRAS